MPTKIEWTDETWNPIRGCSRVSEGCRNCYAEGVAYRFSRPGQAYEGLVRIDAAGQRKREWNGVVRMVEERLADPLRWSKPRRIFVNSMSDLFHESVSDLNLLGIFAVMANTHIATGSDRTPHTFQILTKRPQRMLDFMRRLKWRVGLAVANISGRAHMLNWMPYLDGDEWVSLFDGTRIEPNLKEERPGHILKNVWLGVSVENQKAADERIPLLLQTPAALRFISAEPLLGPVDLYHYVGLGRYKVNLDWVILGGESGAGARPMNADWARNVRDECVVAGVPFFFKQWGEWLPGMMDGAELPGEQVLNCGDNPLRVGKKAAGDTLDLRQWHEFPGVSA